MRANLIIAKTSSMGDALWLPLPVHLRDTAGIMDLLVREWLPMSTRQVVEHDLPDDVTFENLCRLIALTHDVGKATPLFVASCVAALSQDLTEIIISRLEDVGLQIKPHKQFTSGSQTPHALMGSVLLRQAGCERTIAAVVGAHHGKPQSSIPSDDQIIANYDSNFYLNRHAMPYWQTAQTELIAYAVRESRISSLESLPRLSMASQILLTGLLIMADWIASNNKYFPLIDIESTGEELNEQTRVEAAWSKLSLPPPWEPDNAWAEQDLYRLRFDFDARPVQRAMAEAVGTALEPGIFVLEAPMGVGKTEAALVGAEILSNRLNCGGLFFALPTQATSNGLFPRMMEWAQKESDTTAHSIRLAHAMAQLNSAYRALFDGSASITQDEDGGVVVHSWFEGRKVALLADFVLGTVDQLLLAALKQKHVMLRHLGLAGKVVVIDECHAYDAYMNQYLERALAWLGAYHVPVIVLSATLPVQRRRRIVEAYLGVSTEPAEWQTSQAYPLLVYSEGKQVRSRVVPIDGDTREVSIVPMEDDTICAELSKLLVGGGCAGVIVNTVARAQKLAAELLEHFGEANVLLFHARFLSEDRAEKEEFLLQALGNPSRGYPRPEKLIVVGTQVLEQSLDIDFDVMITDLCPMDLLLQRIGRLHRHSITRPIALAAARCYVLGMMGDMLESGASKIYGDYLLMRTRALLPPIVMLPSDISPLVQAVYDPEAPLPQAPAGYERAKEKWIKDTESRESRANAFRVLPPSESRRSNPYIGWLDTSLDITDQRGEAAVRDGLSSIDVLVMRDAGADGLAFVRWRYEGRAVSTDYPPSKEDAYAIANQRVRLPFGLCANDKIMNEVIDNLSLSLKTRLAAWQESPLIKGELVLILDENLSATLCKHRLTYSRQGGLLDEKEEDYAGKGI